MINYHINNSLVGCWIDGSYGIEHANAKLLELVTTYVDDEIRADKDTAEALRMLEANETSDDMWESEHCTQLLAEACPYGLTVSWIDGDLVCYRTCNPTRLEIADALRAERAKLRGAVEVDIAAALSEVIGCVSAIITRNNMVRARAQYKLEQIAGIHYHFEGLFPACIKAAMTDDKKNWDRNEG
jgi:hypothetical protein